MLTPSTILLVFSSIVFSCLFLWARAITRVSQGQSILPAEPHRPAPWSFVDLCASIVFMFGLQFAAAFALRYAFHVEPGAKPTIDDYYHRMLLMAICTALAFVISFLWVRWRTGATANEMGFTLREVGRDVAIGVGAFVMLAPVVFGIQAVLVLLMGPTQHPLILLLQKSPDVRLFWAASLNAVLIAPVVEEYFFRGLLQGWAETLGRHTTPEQALFGRSAPRVAPVYDRQYSDPELETNPYRAATAVEEPVMAKIAEADFPTTAPWRGWLPILLSSLLFSLAHWGNGPDLLALFVLAMGLGYVYQRTHRLLPCILVHFLLNLTSMLLLWTQLFAPQ
jgi:membrane protease YdiL (CAAX protease family)